MPPAPTTRTRARRTASSPPLLLPRTYVHPRRCTVCYSMDDEFTRVRPQGQPSRPKTRTVTKRVVPSCADACSANCRRNMPIQTSALVSQGDQITIHWPMDDGSTKPFDGEVTHCKASHRKRHGERFRYTIRFADGDVRKTRLRHLAWCRSAPDVPTGPHLLLPHELPFDASSDDHCETPLAAYQDVVPILRVLAASLGKPLEDLRIYDPYYCDGAVGRNLGSPRLSACLRIPLAACASSALPLRLQARLVSSKLSTLRSIFMTASLALQCQLTMSC